MNRDTYIFGGFVALFALISGILLGVGNLSPDASGFGTIVAAGFTLLLYSFLYKDNPLFKFGEHVYVGIATAYVFGQIWFQVLYGDLIRPVFYPEADDVGNTLHLIIPTILGLLMLTRFSRTYAWLSKYAFAFFVGLGAGFTIPRYLSSYVLGQIEPSLAPLSWSAEGVNLFIILVGVVTVLIYFFFSVEHKGVVGGASKIGIWFLMVAFGASFGYTIMARLSLLIGRITFLLQSWLGISLT
jgi:hypothetical protein